jgi:glutamate 5-kinase
MQTRSNRLKKVKRLVVKIGTNLIIGDHVTQDKPWLTQLAEDISKLRHKGLEIVIVSSGAVGAGMYLLGIQKRPRLLPMQQACASVGQNFIMQLWEKLFRKDGILVGQVLLTYEDLRNRERYFNLRHTINSLLEMGVIPVINENDSVAVDEIRVGDNDTLAAYVTNFVQADLLLILTDTDGLYDKNPKEYPEAELINQVDKITPQIRQCCGHKGSELSVGGMKTKLSAAEIVTRSGEMMLIANGYKEKISDLLSGKTVGTLFLPAGKGLSSRKRFIAFAHKTKGNVYIDEGGVTAIRDKNKSLLPVGIMRVDGNFKKGDIIAVKDLLNRKIARGVSNFSAEEIEKIKGLQSAKVTGILGRGDYQEVIHKDNLVIVLDAVTTSS